jgi:ferritin-like metal-binding protein YciE
MLASLEVQREPGMAMLVPRKIMGTSRPTVGCCAGKGGICQQEPPLRSPPTAKGEAMAKELKDLFVETLKDIYYAEKQILRALPKMARDAQSPELKKAFETHREETEGHVDRLQQVFELIEKPARGKTCDAILGIIEEGKEVMDEFKGAPALDAGLTAAAQAVEHYEIARYGTLKTWAGQLGLKEAASLLDQTLQEEIKTDKLLSQLAQSSVNQKAA